MTCADTDRRFAEWLAGTLPEADARALEAHAGECAACGDRLERAFTLPTLPAEVTPPSSLRADLLASIAGARRRQRRVRWLVSASAVAAVMFFALVQQPRRKEADDLDNGAAILFAMERARPELESLDEAERELTAALQRTPDDRALAHALEDLRRQRQQLQKLVRGAAS
jgi:hypothetical protein